MSSPVRAKQFYKASVIIALAIVLSSCGFHLRGGVSDAASRTVQSLSIHAQGKAKALSFFVRREMLVRGLDEKSEGDIKLNLQHERIEKKLIAIDSQTGWQEIQVNYQLFYDFSFGGKPPRNASVKLIRSFTFTPGSILSAEAESDDLLVDIRKLAAERLINSLIAGEHAS